MTIQEELIETWLEMKKWDQRILLEYATIITEGGYTLKTMRDTQLIFDKYKTSFAVVPNFFMKMSTKEKLEYIKENYVK